MKLFLFFSVPAFVGSDESFAVNTATSKVDVTWGVTDDCSAKTGFTVTGYKVSDTLSTVTVSADAAATTAVMDIALFAECEDYVFGITMAHTAAGPAVVSPRTTTAIMPNIAGIKIYVMLRG